MPETTVRPVGQLGRLPGKMPVGLHELSYYVAGSLPKPPAEVAVPDFADWGMLGNNQYGCCGPAGLEHGFEANATIAAEHEAFPSAEQCVDYYLAYTGGQDTGVVLADYLAYVRQHGYYGHTVDSYAPVAVQDVPTLQTAVFLYGFAYTGIVVTAEMQQAFANHEPWNSAVVNAQPIGGHCVPICGYDDQFLYIVTWGAVQPITYPAWHRIASEAWAVITGEFVTRNGDGRGVSLEALRADLDSLAA